MCAKETVAWYSAQGWREINSWLCEMAAKGCNRVYLGNLEVIPDDADKETLVRAFNAGSLSWKLELDDEGDFVCSRKQYCK